MNMLHIVSLQMKGCRRLLHKGIKEIRYSPEAKLQIVTGFNGFGKSTLLHHLSPLPPSPKEFIKGGSKDLKLEYGGSQYHLICDFTRGSHYSFLKDGKELNDGHTQTIQRVLVEQHLAYTNDIHLLLTGKVKLTQLPVQKRKEWLVKLCQTDVSYALGLYNRLSQSYRKATATREHLAKKLIDVSAKLMSQDDFDALNTEIKTIASEDQQIIDAIGFVEWTDSHQRAFAALEKEIIEMSLLISQKMPQMRTYSSQTELDVAVQSAEHYHADIEDKLKQKYHEYDTLTDAVTHMQSLGTQTVSELEEQCAQLKASLPDISGSPYKDIVVDIDAALTDAMSIKDKLNNLLLTLPLNPDMLLYNRQTIGERRTQLKDLEMLLHRDQTSLDRATARIKELEDHEKLQCPSCNHEWVPGFSEKELQTLKVLVDKYRAEIEQREAKLATLREWLQYSSEWLAAYKQYTELYDSFPRHIVLFDTFVDNLRIYNNPASLVGSIDQFIHDLQVVREYRRGMDQLQLLEHALSQKKILEDSNISALTEKLNAIVRSIEDIHVQNAEAKTTYQQIHQYQSDVMEVVALTETVKENVKRYCSMMIAQAKHQTNLDLRQILSTNADRVKVLNSTLTDAISSKGVVEHIHNSIQELDTEIEAFDIVLSELSPKEGLIAEALGGFGNALAEQMNRVIKKIWTTPLRIRPCAVKDGDLDYQFPLSSAEDVEDISMGSDGELEVIDYAFMMVSRSYLGLQKLPLFLDEVGRAFHEQHKSTLYQYVKGLIDGGLVNQVFVVSHSPTAHSTLVHADLNIIDPTGTMISPNANKHLILS